MMQLSLSIQMPDVEKTLPIAQFTGNLEEKLGKAAALGADGVELITTHPAQIDTVSLQERLTYHQLKPAAIASGGMAFAAGLTLLHADESISRVAQQRLDELIQLAGAIGAPVITIGSFRGRTNFVGVGARERLAGILREAGQQAGLHGVRLALEPLNRYETDFLFTVEETLVFLKEIDNPAVGVLVDTYQANIEEASRTGPFLQAIQAGKLFHVHIADNNRLPPGCGMIDFAAIVESLNAARYTGFLSAELLPHPDADTSARETLTFMRKLVPDTRLIS
ncbi:MAG: sugar phosphate isomerase/epimerase [Anaerolineaceae bacterium]|nr:sugar phosphate isomerase/epimerase [Anaerolineaceae bacterium]